MDERRRKRVLDRDPIRRGLQDSERLAGLLPLEDQKGLLQLLLRDVVVWHFEPPREASQEEAPAEAARRAGARAFTTKIRTRYHRVRIGVYQLPNMPYPLSVNHSGTSSGFEGIGSPRRGKSRTFFPVTIITSGGPAVKRRESRPGYHFAGTPLPSFPLEPDAQDQPAKQHRNPIAVAREWQRILAEGECASRADLARELGVSRARVTQVLNMLDLAPEVLSAIEELGDPLPGLMVSERRLRLLRNLPPNEQRSAWQELVGRFSSSEVVSGGRTMGP